MTTNGSTTTSMDEDDELATLFPAPVEFRAGKQFKLDLLPMDLAACQRFATVAKPIIDQLLGMRGEKTVDVMLPQIALAASQHPDELREALAIATGKSAAFIGKLPPGVAMALAQVVLQVNVDFFVLAVGSLEFATTEPAAATNGNGLIS